MRLWVPLTALALAISPLALVHPVRVSGHSMEPLLQNGEVRLALRQWCAGHPTRQQVWLVEGPEGPVIKRIVGLPGDRLEQRDGEIYLNEQRLTEPYLNRFDVGSLPPMEAGDGFLVLGDNRRESVDSRRWGPLPTQALRGRILGL